MKKKGLSTIITYLLLILLSIVAISILFVFVRGIITKEIKVAELKAGFFGERIEIQKVDFSITESLVLNITLKKFTGEIVIKSINETEAIPLEVDVISVSDLSGSMGCSIPDGYASQASCEGLGGIWLGPLNSSKEANKELVQVILVNPEETISRIGLIGYASDVLIPYSLSLTDEVNELNNVIDSWEAGGNTCICCGINNAISELESESSDETTKAIIVMSDGEANIECPMQGTGDSKQDAIQSACDANLTLENIVIYSVGLGELADEQTLTNIANCADGKYFSAQTIGDLIAIYQSVAAEIKKEYEDKHQLSYLLIRFYDETGNTENLQVDVPETLSTQKYEIDLTNSELIESVKRIEIYPVIITPDGDRIIGPMLDYWETK